MNVKYLTAQEIVVINKIVINMSGGSVGVRDSVLLESISHKPQTSFGGNDLYPDLFLKAAVLYEALINYHVFVDGNKRTGLAAMVRFLNVNGHKLKVTNKQMVAHPIHVATEKLDLAEIAIWIKKHAKQI